VDAGLSKAMKLSNLSPTAQAQARAQGATDKPRHKFGAVPAVLDGIWFGSTHESQVYASLLVRLRAGEIRNLELQVPFPIVVNGVMVGKYLADFAFFEDQKRVIVDAKGFATPLYKFKRKCVEALYPAVEFREVKRSRKKR
jgi:Protein of unknown function (DUF1064)